MSETIKSPGSLAALRREYSMCALNEADVAANPIDQFHRWFADARVASLCEPNAMTLPLEGGCSTGAPLISDSYSARSTNTLTRIRSLIMLGALLALSSWCSG